MRKHGQQFRNPWECDCDGSQGAHPSEKQQEVERAHVLMEFG